MKISKYITAVILLAVATLLLVIFNTDNFPHSIPNSYRLYVKDSTISLEEIDAAARAKNAVFFAITSNEINLQKEECTIFAAPDNTDAVLNDFLGLKTGTVKDILGNETVICCDELSSF